MSKNGNYFNSAQENEEWLREVLSGVRLDDVSIAKEKLEGQLFRSNKLNLSECIGQKVKMLIGGSRWELNAINQIEQGTVCNLTRSFTDTEALFCIIGSVVTSVPIDHERDLPKHITHLRNLISLMGDYNPTPVNILEEISYLASHLQIVENGYLLAHKMYYVDSAGQSLYYPQSERDDTRLILDNKLSVSFMVSNLQLI